MMNLSDIVKHPSKPVPWAEGENIPWHDPAFSERMLAEHLTQDHDLASRRKETIDKHVQWIHNELLGKQPMRILDLGCGPGLYTSRLAALGHECVGIDYSPASIQYAEKHAKREKKKEGPLPPRVVTPLPSDLAARLRRRLGLSS